MENNDPILRAVTKVQVQCLDARDYNNVSMLRMLKAALRASCSFAVYEALFYQLDKNIRDDINDKTGAYLIELIG